MSDGKLDLGSFMWNELSTTFNEVVSLNAGPDHAKKAQIWAGFMAAATGSMCKSLGPADTALILKAVSDVLPDVARDQLKLVTP